MKFFIIDGSSYCYRAYHALPSLINSKGQPTGAVYGFVAMLRKLLEQNPDYLAVCFDLKEPTFRHKRYANYKVHRPPMPDELVSQLELIKGALSAFRIPVFAVAGYEADDLLATFASRWAGEKIEAYLVTGDKDMLQIVSPHIMIYNEDEICTPDKVRERYEVDPERIPEVLALMGDSADNIPGVPGIGEKTAIELLKKFGSLDGIYADLDKIQKKNLRENLSKYKEQVEESLGLLRVVKDVPIDVKIEDLKLSSPDDKKLFEIYRELEFKSLLKELPAIEKLDAVVCDLTADDNEGRFYEELNRTKEMVLYFAVSAEGERALAMSVEKGVAFYLRFASAERPGNELFAAEQYSNPRLWERLKVVLEDEAVKKNCHDLKSLKLSLSGSGVELKGLYLDTMLTAYLIDPGKAEYGLDELGLDYFGCRLETGKKKTGVSSKDIPGYAGKACHLIFKLKDILLKELQAKELDNLYFNVELPLASVLCRMEEKGVKLNVEELMRQSGSMEKKLNLLTKEIYEIAGAEFNINSPKQLSQVLFEKLKLPVLKRTKTGISTDVEVLEKLARQHALPAVLLKYRELSKLKSTYIDALPELVRSKDGRLHTTFNQAGTATGRLSSSNPNLQNIPVKTEDGRIIRRAFVSDGREWLILSADYSQIELRILAHLSGDADLKEAFQNGRDIHVYTASLIHKVDEDKVTQAMRSIAKTVNFGIIYGMSPYGLARDLDMPVEEAQIFINSYFDRYPGVEQFLKGTVLEARGKGYVTTMLGRRRYIPQINSNDNNIRQFSERIAVNTPIQGSAADMIKVAMVEIDKRLAKENSKASLILQVHDELVLDVPKEEIEDVIKIVRTGMKEAISLSVPVEVNIKAGDNWLDLKEA
ncbi:MAG: DNA polymerase I [Candidatus Omnitrophica bacterium]|nr:DNA polymerase I [Candidatus Omnitrophota bacterium]